MNIEFIDVTENRKGTCVENTSTDYTSVRTMLSILKILLKKHHIKDAQIRKKRHFTKGEKNNLKKIKNDKNIRKKTRSSFSYA